MFHGEVIRIDLLVIHLGLVERFYVAVVVRHHVHALQPRMREDVLEVGLKPQPLRRICVQQLRHELDAVLRDVDVAWEVELLRE